MGIFERLPDWPAAMDRSNALVFTGVAETVLRQYERLGVIRFKPVGPHGAKVARKEDLQRMLNCIFELGDDLPPSEDMDI
jgi:hypothetical protein